MWIQNFWNLFISLTICSIAAEFHSTIQSISEHMAIFFRLFILKLLKTWFQFNQNEKKDQVPDETFFPLNKKAVHQSDISTCLTWNGAPKPFFYMDVEWKWHTKDIYRKNFYQLLNAFIYIKTRCLHKTVHHHTLQTLYKIIYKNGSPRHLIAVPSIIISGTKWKEKYMEIDLTSRLKMSENWRSGSKVYGMILPSIYQRFYKQSNNLLED